MHDRKMCDSAVMLTAVVHSETSSRCLTSSLTFTNSKAFVDLAEEIQSDGASLEVSNVTDGVGSCGSCNEGCDSSPYRIQLQEDVKRLQQQLQEEIEVHDFLENAMNNAPKISCPSFLPHHVQELLSAIAVLEVTVSKMEQEIVTLHFQLSQERNERRLAEYRLRHSASQSVPISSIKDGNEPMSPSLSFQKHSDFKLHRDGWETSIGNQPTESSYSATCTEPVNKETLKLTSSDDKNFSKNFVSKPSCQPDHPKRVTKGLLPKGLWDHPNRLSEEMVRCMKNIFMTLVNSSMPLKSMTLERGSPPLSLQSQLSSSSSWWTPSDRLMNSFWVQSPQVDIRSNSNVLATDGAFDPYRVHGKLSWADIGNYTFTSEVSWMSVGKKQLEYASGALRKFRILVEQLAQVNPVHLSSNEKLAFWINLYNALIMHAYLAYGVPRSDLKLFSLMQKAAYTVGGHSFSAAAIEYMILKMKPPMHRPQIALLLALQKLKVSDEQRKSTIDAYEPLAAFALSCGMYSSPAVRIYTAENVREELQEAQHDFIRASVGVSIRGKLLVPKMLHCFAKAYVDDSNLAVWISRYLLPNQAAFVEECISQRRQRILSSRNCGILPFDSHFRYLFLPDKISIS